MFVTDEAGVVIEGFRPKDRLGVHPSRAKIQKMVDNKLGSEPEDPKPDVQGPKRGAESSTDNERRVSLKTTMDPLPGSMAPRTPRNDEAVEDGNVTPPIEASDQAEPQASVAEPAGTGDAAAPFASSTGAIPALPYPACCSTFLHDTASPCTLEL